jgi:hypothetical protein
MGSLKDPMIELPTISAVLRRECHRDTEKKISKLCGSVSLCLGLAFLQENASKFSLLE